MSWQRAAASVVESQLVSSERNGITRRCSSCARCSGEAGEDDQIAPAAGLAAHHSHYRRGGSTRGTRILPDDQRQRQREEVPLRTALYTRTTDEALVFACLGRRWGGGEREGKRARPKRLLSPPNAIQETAALPQTLVAFHSKVQTSRGKPFCLFPHSIPLLLSLNPIGYEPALLPKPSLLLSINPKRQTDPPDRCIQYHIGTRAT